jgi:hypothetical protein
MLSRVGRGRTGGAVVVAIMSLAGAVGAQSPGPSGAPAPLPVRLVEGTCDEPGEVVLELMEATAPEPAQGDRPMVHVSVSEVPDAIEGMATERVVLVGGVDAESAVACGQPGPVEDGASVGVLSAQHDSGHAGAILMSRRGDGTLVEIVVVSPAAPEVSPSASPAADASPTASGAPASPAASDAGLSPVRSAEPGTSGAPPFSPLPAG